MHYRRNRVRLSSAVLATLFACGAHAGTIWRNDWFALAPQTLDTHVVTGFDAKPTQAVAFAADGEAVVAAPTLSRDDVQVTRRRVDGTLRWTLNLEALHLYAPVVYAIQPLSDAGVIVAWGSANEDYGSHVARISAMGALQWIRELPSGWLAMSAGRIVIAGCGGVSAVDADSGNLAWQRDVPAHAASCRHGGMATDASGSIYVLQPLGSVYNEAGFRLRKYSADGELQWTIVRADPFGSGDLIGIGAAHAFVRTRFSLDAIDLADGGLAWSTSADVMRVALSTDGLQEPIVAGAGSIRRLAVDTGTPRWVTPIADARVLDPVGDALLVATPTSRLRLDAATGTVSWSLPDGALQTTWLAFGSLGTGEVRAIGRPWPLALPGMPLVDRRLDFATGDLLAVAPPQPQLQGLRATRVRDQEGAIVEAALSPSSAGVQLVVRRVDATTGTTLWQQAEDIPELEPGGLPSFKLAVGDDVVVVSLDNSAETCAGQGWFVVSRHALADGARSWRTTLRDIDQGCTTSSTPAIDAAGNVHASVVALIDCPGGAMPPCYRRTLYRLAAVDGSVAWRRDEVVHNAYEIVFTPQTLLAHGGDVLAYTEYFDSRLRRFAGTDGGLLWERPLLPGCCVGERLQRVDAQHLLEHSLDYTSLETATVHWSLRDAATGSPEWSASADVDACYGLEGCYMATQSMRLPDGDLVLLHQRDYASWMWRLAGDGSGAFEERLVVPAGDWVGSLLHSPVLDDQGQLWAVLCRSPRAHYLRSLAFLVRVNPATGALSEQQALGGTDDASGDGYATGRPLAASADGHALLAWMFRTPPAPFSSSLARVDANVTARGNLSVSVETDRSVVEDDAALLVQARVRYAGDSAAPGVRTVVSDDWGGGVRDASCTTLAGGTCTLDLRNGQVVAMFDAEPIDGIDLLYTIEARGAADAHKLIATAHASLRLAEADTLDNFAYTEVAQALFVDGFEAAD